MDNRACPDWYNSTQLIIHINKAYKTYLSSDLAKFLESRFSERFFPLVPFLNVELVAKTMGKGFVTSKNKKDTLMSSRIPTYR